MRVTTAQDLGNLVREKREAKAMTQRQLAALAGVSRLWLVHVEAGHPGAEFGRILHLVASLDMALDLVERHSESTWGDLLAGDLLAGDLPAQEHNAVAPTALPSSGQDR